MKKINVGMVGVGGIANGVHIPGYLQSRDGEVVAICDINPAALARTAERLHIPPERCFADYHELIACPDVEVVDIATPDVWHCPIAMEAIRQHKPVS
ncbi:MAG: Gfo/Idh/MocA family oxidoreductase, partial [Clostridia bacterium]